MLRFVNRFQHIIPFALGNYYQLYDFLLYEFYGVTVNSNLFLKKKNSFSSPRQYEAKLTIVICSAFQLKNFDRTHE